MTKIDIALLSVGIDTVQRIAETWALTDAEMLQLISPVESDREVASKFAISGASDAVIQALRVSCLLGIHGALSRLFADSSQAGGWIRRPNDAPLLAGSTALDYMIVGGLGSMIEVRRLLEAQLV